MDEKKDWLTRLSLTERLKQLNEDKFPSYLSKIDLLKWRVKCSAHPPCWVALSNNPEVQSLQQSHFEESKMTLMALDKIQEAM